MKFIHCADLHLDSKMQTNLSPEYAATRNREVLNTFENMVTYAQQQEVTGMIIAGDMFDTEYVSKETKQRVVNTINKHPQIDFIYLPGNHDETNFIAQLTPKPTNLKLFNNTWQTFGYGTVKITGRASDEQAVIRGDELHLLPQDINIVVLHGDIHQNINLNHFQQRNIDYLALGHLHSYSHGQLDARGIYCYAGCLEGRGFDECGPKGFVQLDIDTEQHKLKSQFVPFAKRQIVEIKIDLAGQSDWFAIEDQIMAQVQNIDHNNLLKIVLMGKYDLSLEKQTAMLSQKLDRFYAVKIKDESTLAISDHDIVHDVSLRGEFMRLVLASNLSDAEKERTIRYGLQALSGDRR